jgi:signal transduction histidine kinase
MLEEDEPAPRAKDLARIVLSQTARITAIVQNLLDFGRRGGSALPRVKPAVELQVAVSTAVDLLAATARKRGATIELVAGAPSLAVRANRQEVEQVVSNLILNGIQAMPDGGQVTVETRSEQHPGRDGRTRTFGTIVVADQGRGISATDLPHIFDPFFTTKDVGEGTGLGLSVTYGIVTDLGGMIDVATELGHGTRFVVRLPLA